MQKEREEEERPTRHSHYLIHGTPSQPSDKSLARWDGALKADEREIQKALNHEEEEEHCFKLNSKRCGTDVFLSFVFYSVLPFALNKS